MYFRMLKKDIKDKPALNIVTFIFMIAAVLFTVIGSTMLYSIMVGEKKTYDKCSSSDVYFWFDQSMTDHEGVVGSFDKDLKDIDIITDTNYHEVVYLKFSCIDYVDSDVGDIAHYSSGVFVSDMPDKYDIPIDLDSNYFEVPDGCVAISQVMSTRYNIDVGDRIRLTTQFGNIYEYIVSTVYKNPASVQMEHFYLSDRDTAQFYSECPLKYDMFECRVQPGLENYLTEVRDNATELLLNYEDYHAQGNASRVLFMNNDGLFAIIVTASMLVVAVAIMIMTMITIDFSLKSAIKREEREIGMMKAIGVWSLSYKTLFIVKYLFFALLGGVIGLPAGFIISKILFDRFVMNVMYPDVKMMILIGLIVGIVTVAVIILFSFIALRRMNKISVIDAIHGDNRGERFTNLPGLSLSNKKHIPVPLFFALTDILRGFKRYLLLIIAYILGVCVVLFIVRLNDTIMSTEYSHIYFQEGRSDFWITIDDSYYDKLISGAGSFEGAINVINKNFEDNDIPAKITVKNSSNVVLRFNGGETIGIIEWFDSPTSELVYLEGNPPKLRNEVAMGAYICREKNIKVGDTVTIEYDKYSDDRSTFSKVQEEFVVTGMVDHFGANSPTMFMGDDFEGSVVTGSGYFSCKIDAPVKQHEDYINKMQALYPDHEVNILRNNEIMPYRLIGYKPMLRLIIIVVSIISAIVGSLLTILYENIFIDDESADIALLKSMGFGKETIRAWHFLRLMILAILSMILSFVFMSTIGNYLVGLLFRSLMKSAHFDLFIMPFDNYVIIPACVISLLAVVIYFMTYLTDKIQIWKVRNE